LRPLQDQKSDGNEKMKLGLVIASHRRPDLLQKVVERVLSQRRNPDEIILSIVDPSDLPEIAAPLANVRTVMGSAGLTSQRNRGISCLVDNMDLIAFIDDDFIVGDGYFLNIERIFEQDHSIVGMTGEVIADGAKSRGMTFEEGVQLVEQHGGEKKPAAYTRDNKSAYGCNMAFRAASIGSLRFDENLALYGWLEDLDFCGALSRSGRIVKTNVAWGIHLGTKRGKGSEVGFGYSQIVNPAYIARKGNMPRAGAFWLAVRNLLANVLKSIHPESYVDRRGRLRGNLIGIAHLLTGRLTPEYVLKINSN
jgi:glycosyltransferase involved in cell wall biosynthesis